MNKIKIRIQLLKFAVGNDKYRHFNTVYASNYEELLDKCNYMNYYSL